MTRSPTKLIREWTWDMSVGIYDNCTATIRLYADRCIVRMPGVKWEGNTGGYHLYRSRIEAGKSLDKLLAIAAREDQDNEDSADQARELISEYKQGY